MESWEEEVGMVDHYYNHAHIAGIYLKKGLLKIGDKIHIKGHTTDLTETIESLQIHHASVHTAGMGAHVGVPVHDKVRLHDRVFIIHM